MEDRNHSNSSTRKQHRQKHKPELNSISIMYILEARGIAMKSKKPQAFGLGTTKN